MLEVVKKLSMVVTPRVTLAGSAFHSIQNVTNEEVTSMSPGEGIIVTWSGLDNKKQNKKSSPLPPTKKRKEKKEILL